MAQDKIEYFERSDYEPNTNMEYRHIWVKDFSRIIIYELVQTSTYTWKVYEDDKLVLDNASQKEIIAKYPVLRRALKSIQSALSIRVNKKFGDEY